MDKLKKSSYNIFGVKFFWQQVILKIIFNSRGLNITGIYLLLNYSFVNSWEDFIWYGKGRNNK